MPKLRRSYRQPVGVPTSEAFAAYREHLARRGEIAPVIQVDPGKSRRRWGGSKVFQSDIRIRSTSRVADGPAEGAYWYADGTKQTGRVAGAG
jgi:hypothetical protein